MQTRGDGVTAVVMGGVIVGGSIAAASVIHVGGLTFAAFGFGIVLGAALVLSGLVTVIRGR
jgi:hypothetical protein